MSGRAEETTADDARRIALLDAVWETAPDAIMLVDAGGVVRDFSPSGETMFGFGHDDIIGRDVRRLLPDWARIVSSVGAGGTAALEVEAARRSGSVLPVSLTLGRAAAGGADFVVCFARDRRRMEDMRRRLEAAQGELQQLMRLSTVNMMAGALAHDVNQPLTSAASFVQAADLLLARDGRGATDEPRAALAKGLLEIHRAAEIIRQVRRFVNRRDPERRRASLNAIVRDASNVVGLGLAGDRIGLDLRLAKGLPEVSVDPVQIQQVLFNLMRNAVEAMQDVARPRLVVETWRDGAELVAAVSDIGDGIDQSVRDTLFSPFQTTKNEGLGLGLAICRSIVEAHGGALSGDSRPDGGATFTMRLPIAEAPA